MVFMIARGFGRVINIITSGVKSPVTYPQLGVSIGVRSGLTGFLGVLAQAVLENLWSSGQIAAFLCRRHAGFITGQHIVVDGGAFPGLM